MSSLLDEAIVDAKALREAVLKNAEASLLEAYAPKIEEAVEQLLEQDPAAAALPMDIGAPPMMIMWRLILLAENFRRCLSPSLKILRT